MVAVKDIMHGTTGVDAKSSVFEVALVMEAKDIGSVLVESDGNVVGILTERDILKKIVAKASDPKRIKAKDIMSLIAATIEYDKDIMKASELLSKHRIRRLPVTKNGRIVGIITARDLAKVLPSVSRPALGPIEPMVQNHYPEI